MTLKPWIERSSTDAWVWERAHPWQTGLLLLAGLLMVGFKVYVIFIRKSRKDK